MFIVYTDKLDEALTTKVRGLLSFHGLEYIEIDYRESNGLYSSKRPLPQIFYRHNMCTRDIGDFEDLQRYIKWRQDEKMKTKDLTKHTWRE